MGRAAITRVVAKIITRDTEYVSLHLLFSGATRTPGSRSWPHSITSAYVRVWGSFVTSTSSLAPRTNRSERHQQGHKSALPYFTFMTTLSPDHPLACVVGDTTLSRRPRSCRHQRTSFVHREPRRLVSSSTLHQNAMAPTI